ncbi:regulator of sigma E protease [Trypanosoma cruzi]|nr:regulator of sigma E protease [Trypanosoma cruzi]
MRHAQRSNRRPQRWPYTPHAPRLHQWEKPSTRRRLSVHHRRTHSLSAATLPARGVFRLLPSWCCSVCVTVHQPATTCTASVPGAGASHSALSFSPSCSYHMASPHGSLIVMRSPEAGVQSVVCANIFLPFLRMLKNKRDGIAIVMTVSPRTATDRETTVNALL